MVLRAAWLTVCIVLTLSVLRGAALGGPAPVSIPVYAGLDYNFAPAYVAAAEGLYQRHGIDAKVQNFQSGALGIDAIRSAKVGFVLAGDLPTLKTWSVGDIVGVAPLAWSDSALSLVAHKDIASAADLRGKKVGVAFTASDMIFFAEYLTKHDVPRTEVHLVDVQGSDAVAAFVRGDVDAVFSNTPVTSKVLQAVAGAHYIQQGIAGYGANRVILNAMRTTIEGDPAVVQSVLAAFQDAVRSLQSNAPQAVQAVADALGVPVDVAKANMALFHYSMVVDKSFVDGLTTEGQLGVQLNMLKSPVDWSTGFNAKFLKTVDPGLVTASP
jgi:NitT/TauT family transport system substrate-binding protein